MQVESRRKKKEPATAAELKANQNRGNDGNIDNTFEFNSERFLQIALAVRLLSVVLVQTYFVPDEYWQSLEVAHRKVFGYGHETWEWIEAIRPSAYPLIFALLYKILWFLHLDYALVLINSPRILQACLSAFADVKLFEFSTRLFGRSVGCYAYLLNLLSWFIFYTGARTLSNTTEMALIVIALASLDWKLFSGDKLEKEKKSPVVLGLSSCVLSCVLRPSAATTWLPILLYELYYDMIRRKSFRFLKCGAIIGLGLFSLSTLLDCIFYDRLIFVHWKFLLFNVIRNLSEFYGSHPWHWYVTQGIPVVMFTQLPLMLLGFATWKENVRPKVAILLVILAQVIPLSFVEHKEFRFLLPTVPLLVCLAANGLNHLVDGNMQLRQLRKIKVNKTKPEQKSSAFVVHRKGLCILAFMCFLNSLLALYTGLVHQRGSLDVMTYLRQDLTEGKETDSVLFLMPCHSTPYYSHIHMNIPMRFLGCQPSLKPGYIEEADLFYSNSTEWLRSHLSRQLKPSPSHIITYNVLLEDSDFALFLKEIGYIESERFFHTHFPEGRVGSHVLVLSRGKGNTNSN